jgi:plastocyanin
MKRAAVFAAAAIFVVTGITAVRGAQHVIGQKDTTFSEKLLWIKVGDVVAFLNDDVVTHNVYSLSPNNVFNLKTFAPGVTASHRFTSPGKVEVQCALHPSMKLLINVMP